MPTYILLSSLTPEGSQTLHKDPDRLDAVNKEISEFGCKVVAQYRLARPLRFPDDRRRTRQRDRCPYVCRSVVARRGQDHDSTCDSGCPAQS